MHHTRPMQKQDQVRSARGSARRLTGGDYSGNLYPVSLDKL